VIASALPTSLVAAIPVAIAAGFVSFASPCVLPLVPGYIAFLGGAVGREVQQRRHRAVLGAVSFILGFSAVFISEGALFGYFGLHLRAHERILAIVFGIITILLGLFFAGWLPGQWLGRELRPHRIPSATVLGAFVLGLMFSLGWAPCVTPTLSAILGFALASGFDAARGSLLSFFYCLGLGVPFVVVAAAGEWAADASRWLRRNQRVISVLGGLLLVGIGVCECSGAWAHFVTWMQSHWPTIST
jgi:cytochrome c-type biogenesis protein